MATRQQIRGRAYALISEEEGSSKFTATEINGFADEAVRFLAPLIKWPRDFVEVQVQDGIAAYPIAPDTILIRTAYFGDASVNGDKIPIDILTEEALKSVVPNWMDETTQTKGRPRRVILLDRKTVLINPRPDATESATGKKLSLGYVYLPPSLNDDSSEPDLPVSFHDLVVDYVVYKCYSGKLDNSDEATRTLTSIMARSKLLEAVVTKETDQLQMTWGNADNLEEDEDIQITF